MKSQKNAGFTLMELLVVVLIIGLLAAVALPQYETAVRKSRFMTAVALARPFVDAVNRYQLANGQATYKLEDLDIQCPSAYSTYMVNDESKISICRDNDKRKELMISPGYLKYKDIRSAMEFDWLYQERILYCIAHDEAWRKVCKSLGATETDRADYYQVRM